MPAFDRDATVATFTADPAVAKTTPAVVATLVDGHARLSVGSFNWDADLPPVLGGGNQAPSPTAYLLGALAGCAVAFLGDTLAPEFRVEITSAWATARCATDLAGLVGVDGAVADLTDLSLDIEIDSPSAPDRVAAMQQAWLDRCPVLLALRNANDVAVSFRGPAHAV